MLNDLPDDILHLIIECADLNCKIRIRMINKEYNKKISDDTLIRLYVERYKRRGTEIGYSYYNGHEKFLLFVGKNIDRLMFFKSIDQMINIVDIAAYGGYNDTLILLRK